MKWEGRWLIARTGSSPGVVVAGHGIEAGFARIEAGIVWLLEQLGGIVPADVLEAEQRFEVEES